MRHKYKGLTRLLALLAVMLVQTGCKKYIEAPVPATSLAAANVYTDNATAAAVLTGIYAQISNTDSYLPYFDGITSVSVYASLLADELTLYNISTLRYAPYYRNELTRLTADGVLWNYFYPILFIANAAIEGLSTSNSLTPAIQQQLTGEAKFIKAFCYFYLVNLYGDVPLATTTDYKTNSLLPRSPTEKVYEQIITDLKEAQTLLSADYLDATLLTATTERTRPTSWAATALLARVYLYTGDWANAAAQATAVIEQASLYNLTPLDEVFKMNSGETIWSLQPVGTGTQSNTGEGALFVLPPTGPNDFPNQVYLSEEVVNAFETGDQRKTSWVGSVIADNITYYYPYKYKIGAEETATAEYIMVLRLAEQYLIRAEARAQLNNLDGARSDVNAIRGRAGLPGIPATGKPALLTAIGHERQVELFTEWGHRWFDLKRTGAIDTVMARVAPQKDATWNPYKALFPIPQDEINRNVNIVQNPGY